MSTLFALIEYEAQLSLNSNVGRVSHISHSFSSTLLQVSLDRALDEFILDMPFLRIKKYIYILSPTSALWISYMGNLYGSTMRAEANISYINMNGTGMDSG